MFSNLRRNAPPETGGYEGGSGNRHSASLRELGALLRERREAMGVSLAEVEVATKIRQKYLSALESDEWHMLPGEVVGRGFLRNYADYLGLEPNEAIDRRRAVSNMSLSSVLANTSASSNLPPLREVDYRPKEVDLKDEGDGIQRGEIRLTPIFAILGVALAVVAVWWGVTMLANPIGAYFADIPERIAGTLDRAADEAVEDALAETNSEPAAVPVEGAAAVVNPQNLESAQRTDPQAAAVNEQPAGRSEQTDPANPSQTSGEGVQPQAGTTAAQDSSSNAQSGSREPDAQAGAILVPTSTPEQPQPAVEPAPAQAEPEPPPPEPEPQPEPEPEPQPEPEPAPPEPEPAPPEPEPEPRAETVVALPTPTPEPAQDPAPAQPQAAAPACADPRAVISAPGVNQTVAGVLGVTGTAVHDNFQYFKLEYAPGLNAGGGFVYFAGSNVPVSGALLGNLDTRALPNGEYTIRLTVVDQTSNYPPPCDVGIIIQN